MSTLTVSRCALNGLLSEIQVHGLRPAETGGFLISEPGQADHLGILALAGQQGIEKSRDLFEVSAPAIEQLFSWVSERELHIRAQVHSHRRGSFLSPTDLRGGFTVEGFITSVVPDYATPPAHPAHWGWWICKTGKWLTTAPPSIVDGAAEIVVFDRTGVCAA